MDPPLRLAFLLVLITATICDHGGDSAFSFVFNGFPRQNLTTDGAAVVRGDGLLQLTNRTQTQKGHAFFPSAVSFKGSGMNPPSGRRLLSFSTTFVFAIVPLVKEIQAGTNGMTFVVSPTPRLFNNDAEGATYLGVFNSSNNGNASNHIFAVDLDLNDNKIGIGVNGLNSVEAASAGYYATEADGNGKKLTNLTLPSGEPMQLWVDYDAARTVLEVTLAPLNVSAAVGRPKTPILSTKVVNLSDVFLDAMYMGFAGATGLNGPVSQYILGWSFQLGGGPAPPLDLGNLLDSPPPNPKPSPSKQLLLGISLPIAIVASFAVALSFAYLMCQRKKFAEIVEYWEVELYGTHRFRYKDLYMATKGFSEKEVLGGGGFGSVYRGVLKSSDGVEVAVKKVSHDSKQGFREFVAEIVSMGRLRHRNLVQLRGYCRRQGELLLVYDYMPNGSLDSVLFENQKGYSLDAVLCEDNNRSEMKPCALDWDRRLRIIKGVGTGLRYLHEEWEQVVIHRDIKSSNILLDGEFHARLGDFGLARLYDHGTLPTTTHVMGTMGYIAPELSRLGKASKATDVFAFGVFLLEVVCGRRPVEHWAPREEVILVDWVLSRWIKGAELVDCLDKRIRKEGKYKAAEVELVLKLGLLCSHALPEFRPCMREVMKILDGDLELPEVSLDYWSGTLPSSVVSTGGFTDLLTKSSASSSSAVTSSQASLQAVLQRSDSLLSGTVPDPVSNTLNHICSKNSPKK